MTWTEPTATDDSGFVTVISQTNRPGDVFSAGTTTVRYVFADGSGNQAECVFNVEVTSKCNKSTVSFYYRNDSTIKATQMGFVYVMYWRLSNSSFCLIWARMNYFEGCLMII